METSVSCEFCSQKSHAKCDKNEENIFKALPLREKKLKFLIPLLAKISDF